MPVRIDELQSDVTLLPDSAGAPQAGPATRPRALDDAERERGARRAALAARTRAEGFDD
jgi:hypothetical protein